MKRIHIGLSVKDIDASVRFYQAVFGAEPTVRKPDYAKWMLDDPRVNFALESRSTAEAGAHFGIQVEDESELADVAARFRKADSEATAVEQGTCCYARSTKSWALDPAGNPWEVFLTHDQAEVYGQGGMGGRLTSETCCA